MRDSGNIVCVAVDRRDWAVSGEPYGFNEWAPSFETTVSGCELKRTPGEAPNAPVPYTHLTLPTTLPVYILEVVGLVKTA